MLLEAHTKGLEEAGEMAPMGREEGEEGEEEGKEKEVGVEGGKGERSEVERESEQEVGGATGDRSGHSDAQDKENDEAEISHFQVPPPPSVGESYAHTLGRLRSFLYSDCWYIM